MLMAERGTAAGYDQAAPAIGELAEGYVLCDSREAFDQALQAFMRPHRRRGALIRRLRDMIFRDSRPDGAMRCAY